MLQTQLSMPHLEKLRHFQIYEITPHVTTTNWCT